MRIKKWKPLRWSVFLVFWLMISAQVHLEAGPWTVFALVTLAIQCEFGDWMRGEMLKALKALVD